MLPTQIWQTGRQALASQEEMFISTYYRVNTLSYLTLNMARVFKILCFSWNVDTDHAIKLPSPGLQL